MFDEYRFSGSLPENASTYVTREADKELYESLTAGKFCYVLNSRQSGKSSIRVRTMGQLRDAGVECAAIDLSAGGVQNVTIQQWYVDLIDNLIESFDLDVDLAEWWGENQLHSEVTRFRKFIEEVLLVEVKANIVIFIDEIDSVLSLNFPTDDFFALIRACYNQRVDNSEFNRLTFCLLGVASPSNLIEDKQRTPFNIGKAISLVGFQLHEVEPLRRGLEGKFSESPGVMAEILTWTGGQPFLTQKLCQFMLDESEKEKPRTVAEVVKSRVIESWESQDEPEHLRTIRSRIFRNDERAGYLLELYQQIWCAEVEPPKLTLKRETLEPHQSSLESENFGSLKKAELGESHISQISSEITADDTVEQSELLLSGLVARRDGKLRVYNKIYREVFNLSWVENELKNLRPYAEAFRAWVASGGKDESRLLRGKALADAEEWGKDKNLSYQDREFLAASRQKETQEKIAAEEKEAHLERERKDREAAEQRNQVLSQANVKAKRRIRNGTVVLVLAALGAVSLGVFAAREWNKALEAQTKADDANQQVIEANRKFENANTKAQQERKKVAALQQQTEKVKKKVKHSEQQAQQATKKSKAEQRKAKQAENKAKDANLQATKAREEAEKAQQNAQVSNRKAIEAGKKAKAEQQNAEQAKKIANDANLKAREAKEEASKLQNKLALGKKDIKIVKKDVETVQQLSKLAGELRNKNQTDDSDKALRQAGLSFRINDHSLKQAMLSVSMSQAYQKLKKPDEAKKQIDKSLKYLNQTGNNISSDEGLQIQVLVKGNQGNLLAEKYPKQAIKAYQVAYNILQKHPEETNPFKKDKIITANDIELVYRGLLKLQPNYNEKVWNSLKKHFYAELHNFLLTKKWRSANTKMTQLMIFIANGENVVWLNGEDVVWLEIPQIENFSCPDLKKMDDLWKKNSHGNFGFSVQKKIWVEAGNTLGGKLEDMVGAMGYLRFASIVGWYEGEFKDYLTGKGSSKNYETVLQGINKEPFNSTWRGALPFYGVNGGVLGGFYGGEKWYNVKRQTFPQEFAKIYGGGEIYKDDGPRNNARAAFPQHLYARAATCKL
ncbi:MAG: AAA-like domain-containing protein [Calothrix sp. MO_167.B12]|nr:AAA-like domain-containing protein [Calothrix sp. MO_167.B12]